MIAIRRGDLAIFMFGFAKNDRANINAAELDEFRRLARGYLSLTAQQIAGLIEATELMEVTHDEDNSSEVAG